MQNPAFAPTPPIASARQAPRLRAHSAHRFGAAGSPPSRPLRPSASARQTPARPKAGARQSEPNITPLIDVLLVLLIIFMTTLPLSQEGLDLSLPREAQKEPVPGPAPHVVLQYSAGRQLAINHSPVSLESVQKRLQEIFATRQDKTLYIDADPSLRYGEVVPLVDAAKGAGVERVGVITPRMKAGR